VIDEDEVIIQTFNHDASIHHAGFLTKDEVFAISHDERFALYSAAEEFEHGSAMTDFGDVRGVLGCQYVADIAVKTGGNGAVVGAGSQEYAIPIFEPLFLSSADVVDDLVVSYSSWCIFQKIATGAWGSKLVSDCRGLTERSSSARSASLTRNRSSSPPAKTASFELGEIRLEEVSE
jgi:hypothetical protein